MTRLYMAAGAFVVCLGIITAAYQQGRSHERTRAAAQAAAAYAQAIKDIENAETVDVDNPDAVSDLLRRLAE